MRVLELINTLDTGGAERMVSNLALEMQSRGQSVHVVCLRDLGMMPIPKERFEQAGVTLMPMKKPEGFHLKTLFRLVAYVREHQIDVVHTHNHLVNHYGVAAGHLGGAAAVVNTVHGIQTLGMPRWAARLYQVSCWGTHRTVAVTRAVRDAFCASFGGQQRTVVIPNGIELAELLEVQPRQPDGQFVFGSIGRLVPVKDHQSLLRAFALVRQKYPQCRLEILGAGELLETLQQLARELDIDEAVVFHGWSPDIVRFLSRLDAFVLSSLSEGLPLTVLEAMAAGRPVICTAVGGVPDVVENAKCGWLCPPSNPQALADAMLRALDPCERKSRGASGRAAARESYSVDVMTERYCSLFEELVASER